MLRVGCIADDFTGGTDVAAALRRSGLSVALLFDVPNVGDRVPDTEAVVIALKTRTVPVHDAVSESTAALQWLLDAGVQRVYVKYCSTFDSTPHGNIGPVSDAVLEALGEQQTLVCPASPEHGRTTYQGYLFVHDRLLSDSPMRHHPLTPMTDSDLVRLLEPQTDGIVDKLALATVRAGADSVQRRLEELRTDGTRYVVVDAIDDDDLLTVVRGAESLRVLTGGAGLAGTLGQHLMTDPPLPGESATPLPVGRSLVLAGSCSAATVAQVEIARTAMPHHRLDPVATPDPEELLRTASTWLHEQWDTTDEPLLIYSSADPGERRRAIDAMGEGTAHVLERTLGALAREAASLGVARIVVAGGETSGAVVQALGVRTVTIASEEARGVPWCLVPGTPALALLLKSGNFGDPELLLRAADRVEASS